MKIHGQRVDFGETEYWLRTKLPDLHKAVVSLLTAYDLTDTRHGSADMLLVAVMELQDQASVANTVTPLPISDKQR